MMSEPRGLPPLQLKLRHVCTFPYISHFLAVAIAAGKARGARIVRLDPRARTAERDIPRALALNEGQRRASKNHLWQLPQSPPSCALGRRSRQLAAASANGLAGAQQDVGTCKQED